MKNICEILLNKTVYTLNTIFFHQEKESLGYKKIKSIS